MNTKGGVKVFKSGDTIEIYRYENALVPKDFGKKEKVSSKELIEDDFFEIINKKEVAERNRLYRLNVARNDLKRMAREYFTAHSLFITLTYAEHIDDVDLSDKNFKRFIQRVNYFLSKRNLPKCEYLAVRELTKNGRIHYHLLMNNGYLANEWLERAIDEQEDKLGLRWDSIKKDWVQKKSADRKELEQEFSAIWQHGFVDIHKMGMDNDNFGAYITKYMTKDFGWLEGHKSYLSSRGLKPIKSFEIIPDEVLKYIDAYDDYVALAHDEIEKQVKRKKAFTSSYTSEYQGLVEYLEINLNRL